MRRIYGDVNLVGLKIGEGITNFSKSWITPTKIVSPLILIIDHSTKTI